MQNDQKHVDDNSKIGKWMLAATWIIGLILLTYFFSSVLEQRYNPNQSPQSSSELGGVEVRLKRNKMGHYVASGFINGQAVTFLLDTGATNVSVPAHLRDRLGLVAGYQYQAQTANGVVTVAQTRINQLQLGEIELRDIDASLNPGMQQDEILLGMSALKQLEFTQRGEWLMLRYL